MEAHSAALASGITEDEFWRSSPFQTRVKTAAVQKDRRQWAIVNAWHGEHLHRHKKLPDLEKYLATKKAETPRGVQQSPETMFSNLARMAGIKRKKKEVG